MSDDLAHGVRTLRIPVQLEDFAEGMFDENKLAYGLMVAAAHNGIDLALYDVTSTIPVPTFTDGAPGLALECRLEPRKDDVPPEAAEPKQRLRVVGE